MKVNIQNYVILFAILAITAYFGNQLVMVNQEIEKKDEMDLIRKYLLNEQNSFEVKKVERPKLWIHTKYEVNARKWSSFGSRNSTNLNQPYLHLTIKSIIQHCGNDFHICLIDDDSFRHLLPDWNISMATLADPFLTRAREYGMASLLHQYGGMVIPNSFVCFHNLMPLYKEYIAGDVPFVCEKVNRHANVHHNEKRLLFVPDSYFMGCKKNDPVMLEYMDFLKASSGPHFQSQTDFLGDSTHFFLVAINAGKMTMVDGKLVGVKTAKRKTILLEELMETQPLDLDLTCFGIYVPQDELLSRPKYEWYAVLSTTELLNTKPILTKYIIQSLYTTFMDDEQQLTDNRLRNGTIAFVIPSQISGGGI